MTMAVAATIIKYVPLLVALLLMTLGVSMDSVESFTYSNPIPNISPYSSSSQNTFGIPSQLKIKSISLSSPTSLHLATTTSSSFPTKVPNPLKQLPWNVQKEREREIRRNKMERSKIFRQIGIAEDATYEEIVEATDRLIIAAGNNLKQKIQIEIMKDQILQHRLNERLNGLLAQERNTNQEARAMSNYELEGIDEDDLPKTTKEWNAPLWTKGLIVKPDTTQIQNQLRLWGIITVLGIALPPVQDYLGRFTWLICIAQLTFRGMPKQDMDGGGMGMSFNNGRGGGHRKVAFALGFVTWMVGAIIAYGLMPSWARGQRWTNSVAFTIQNLIFGLASCYLQPYKG